MSARDIREMSGDWTLIPIFPSSSKMAASFFPKSSKLAGSMSLKTSTRPSEAAPQTRRQPRTPLRSPLPRGAPGGSQNLTQNSTKNSSKDSSEAATLRAATSNRRGRKNSIFHCPFAISDSIANCQIGKLALLRRWKMKNEQ